MEMKSTDLTSLFEQALGNIPEPNLQEVGIVVQVGDNICKAYGLHNVIAGEVVNFEGGNRGMVMQFDEDTVSIFLLHESITVVEREIVRRTGSVFKTAVGDGFLGRVVNALAEPIDGLGAIEAAEYRPIEQAIPGIIERSPINESLETGIMAIDALVPIGKGQRELLIGNRNTGKTSIAIDTILHQKGKNVLCIYVAIAQRQANLARIAQLLAENGALAYTIIISAQAGQAVLNQYIAPYVGSTMAEYFRDKGSDVLIVYDDLSSHAIAFREMSLLLRRAPGREAYPGDVFYLHARLLERAGKLLNGGSVTALPIAQIQSDDITAYIPTNLISITDGQIFLDTQLFNQGIRPAVNTGLSVSRVGGAAQTAAIKKMTRALRLELTQYFELLDFVQFGTELDESSQKRLMRGKRIIQLFKQVEHETYDFVEQSLMLLLLREGFLDAIAEKEVHIFAVQFVSYVESIHHDLINDIRKAKDVSKDQIEALCAVAKQFSKIFVPSTN